MLKGKDSESYLEIGQEEDSQPLLPSNVKESNLSTTKPHEKEEYTLLSQFLSCLLYTGCSIGMVLVNKAIPMTIDEEYRHKLPQISIIMFQCIIAVLLVEGARIFGIIDYPGLEWSIVKQWIPLNLIFIAMLFSGFLSLVYISVPMVTIFKNITNLFTVFGDWYLFGER